MSLGSGVRGGSTPGPEDLGGGLPELHPRYRVAVLAFRSALVVLALAGGCKQPAVRMSPAEGAMAGGQPVVIDGVVVPAGAAPVVYFGVEPAKGVVIEGPQRIRVLAPPTETPGKVEVAVRWSEREVAVPTRYHYHASSVVRLEVPHR